MAKANFLGVPTSAAALVAAAQGMELPPPEEPKETNAEYLKRQREARRARNPHPLNARALKREKLKGEVVRRRVAGMQMQEIAEVVGVTRATVRGYLEQWVADQHPAPEQAEGLRALMQERLEFLHSTYWKRANALDGKGRRREDWEPDTKAAEMVVKIMDRQAKLMGVDIQPGQTTLLISAESIASYLGWDDAPAPRHALAAGPVIDVAESDVQRLDVDHDAEHDVERLDVEQEGVEHEDG